MEMTSQEHICGICPSSANKPKQRAVFYCVVDKQNFCINCATIHQKIESTSKHALQCLLPWNNQIPCLHQNLQTFYCTTHSVLCCEECKSSNHKNCIDSIIPTEDISLEENKLISQSAEMLRNLEKTKHELEMKTISASVEENEWIRKLKQELEKMNKAKEELERKIRKRFEYIEDNVIQKRRKYNDRRKEHLQLAMKDIRQTQTSLHEPVNSAADHVAKIAALKDCLKKHEGLLGAENDECHMAFLKAVEHDFEAEHYVSASMQNLQESVDSLNKIYFEMKNIFTEQNVEAAHRTTNTQGAVAGETEVKQKYSQSSKRQRSKSERQTDISKQTVRSRFQSESVTMDTPAETRPKTAYPRSLEDYQQMLKKKEVEAVPSIQVTSQCQMNVRVPSDNTFCGITGIAKLDNGYLLMADYENTKLKVFAPCGDFKGQLICDDKPRDMAKAGSHKFLVNFPMAKKIHFVTVETDSSKTERQITLGKKIDTNAKCCGIAFNNTKIYVATQIPHQILILNEEGVTEKIIPGETFFERATYIAVEPDSSIIFISDPNRKIVLGISEEMEEKFRYTVERPHGIVCARNGLLFVADWNWEKGTIHLVNSEGTRIGTLNLENCYCPQKLMFNPDNNTLLVTQWQKDLLTTVYLGDKAFT